MSLGWDLSPTAFRDGVVSPGCDHSEALGEKGTWVRPPPTQGCGGRLCRLLLHKGAHEGH